MFTFCFVSNVWERYAESTEEGKDSTRNICHSWPNRLEINLCCVYPKQDKGHTMSEKWQWICCVCYDWSPPGHHHQKLLVSIEGDNPWNALGLKSESSLPLDRIEYMMSPFKYLPHIRLGLSEYFPLDELDNNRLVPSHESKVVCSFIN